MPSSRLSQRRRRQRHRKWEITFRRSLGVKKGVILLRHRIRLALRKKRKLQEEKEEIKAAAERRRRAVADYEEMKKKALEDPWGLE